MRKAVERAMKYQYEPYDDYFSESTGFTTQKSSLNPPMKPAKLEPSTYIVVSRMDGTYSVTCSWSRGGHEEIAVCQHRMHADSIARALNNIGR